MIALVIIAFAAAGASLLLYLFLRIRALNAGTLLRHARSGRAGVADLLNYASVVEDGIIVCKNGAFMAAWSYQGTDNANCTDEQRVAQSNRLNQALSSLGNGWMMHVDAVRSPAPGYPNPEHSHFPDPISLAIDEERRTLFEGLGTLYESQFVLTLTWFPPVLAQRKFVELMFDDETVLPDEASQTRGLLNQFKREIQSIESRLSSAFTLQRLKAVQSEDGQGQAHHVDAFLGWLQSCLTGNLSQIKLPSSPNYLDTLIGGQELWGGVVPRLGRKFVQVVAIEGFPLSSTPGILATLAELPMPYRWSSRFIFMDTHEAVRHLDKYRKKWRQKVRGFFDQVFNTGLGPLDQDAVSMVNDAEDAIGEVNSGHVAMGYYTSTVILMDEDRKELEASAIKVEKAINRLGFAARVETINTLDAFLGSLPGHGVENVRRPLINTMNLADLLPTSSIWTGSRVAPCPLYAPDAPSLMHCITQGSSAFRFNLHVSDIGHTFMFGPTGSGKSTHLGLIAAQLRRYQGMRIFAFDKGMSMFPLTKAIGGVHFNIAAEEETLAFCPLQFLDKKPDRGWAVEWIESLLTLNGLQINPQQRNEINNAINSMHASGARTLSEFSLSIQDEEIREALKQYTVDGAMGHLLDAEQDGLDFSDFTTFEIEDLMNLGNKFALPVLLYLFKRIEESLDGRPSAIILDEAWLMLDHAVFKDKIREWFKVLRKSNCLVLLATQSLSDATQSGILDVILESTASKIFLPNVHARNEEIASMYYRMGLNKRQIEILATAQPKRHYYYVSEQGQRLYELALGPTAMAFIGASDKESISAIRKLEAIHGPGWVQEWLTNRNAKPEDIKKAA